MRSGLNSTTIPLPNIATEVVASEKAIEQLKNCAKVMMMDSGAGKDIEVLRQGLVSLQSGLRDLGVSMLTDVVLSPCHI